MATVTHKIKFIADFKVVTRQLERAAKALDTSIPGLAKFEQTSRAIESAWTATAAAIKAASAAAKTLPKKVPTGGGGGEGGSGEGAGGGGSAKPKAPAKKRKLPMGLTMPGRVLAGAGGALLAQGAVAGAQAVGGAVTDVVEQGDRAANSRAFSPEEFGRLSAAAKGADTDVAVLEATTLKLNSTLTKAKLDPEFTRGLAALGLQAKDLKGLKPEEQYGLIADKLNDFQDPALRAAAATKLFGDKGAELLPFLAQGSAGIKAAGDQAEKFGLVMSSETANALADTKGRFEQLGMQVEGLKVRLVSAALPAIGGLTDSLSELADAAGPGLADLSEIVGQVLSEGVGFLTGAFERLSAVVGPLLTGALGQFGPVLTTAFDVAADAATGIIEALEEFWGALGLTSETAEDTGAGIMGGLGVALEWVGGAVDIVAEGLGALGSILGTVIDLLFGVSEGGNVVTDTLFAIGGAAMDIVQGGLLYVQNILTYIAELFDLFGSGEWVEGFKRLGEGILDFILEPLRMLVADIIWVADAISEDLVPDSVRAFANNTKMRELSDKQSAKREEKAARKRLSVDDFQEKKRTDAVSKVAQAEEKVGAKRMAALTQEGRKLSSGAGTIQLGARDARGRELAVYLGNRERRDLAAQILGAGGQPMAPAAAALRAAPTLAGLASPGRTALAPVMGGLAAGGGGGVSIQINVPITLPPGTSASDARELAGLVRDIARDEIATQVIRAVRGINPGGLYQ